MHVVFFKSWCPNLRVIVGVHFANIGETFLLYFILLFLKKSVKLCTRIISGNGREKLGIPMVGDGVERGEN